MRSLSCPTESKRFLYYPIIGDGNLKNAANDEDMYHVLETIKQLMIQARKTKLVVPEMEGVAGIVFNRVVRYLIFRTNISVNAYTGGRRDPEKETEVTTKEEADRSQQRGGQNTQIRRNSRQIRRQNLDRSFKDSKARRHWSRCP
ncbi:hypothetical protein QE152_g1724 [Popillia japonica]|uniref:Uncharacterized protein n=1 Tax=Popillia japonica TaxID=7064 RepID=A0AAW1N5I6_POPJA